MHIGGATSYFAPAASSLPARVAAPGVSADLSADPTRAAQSPPTATQPLAEEQAAASRDPSEKAAEPAGSADESRDKEQASAPQQRLEQLEIAKLSKRDQEVRAHEQAHAAVGGRYAGPPTYSFTRGPDGKRYAVGGEVSIESGPIPNDPEATLRKMEIVLRAALAPAEPSAQDLRIAAQAQAHMAQARSELNELRRSEAQVLREAREAQRAEQAEEEKAKAEAEEERDTDAVRQDLPAPPSLELYRRLQALREPSQLINLVA